MDNFTKNLKELTEDDMHRLSLQDSRKVSDYKADLLEKHAGRYWDTFYKRNENRFFKDRHWSTREFQELLSDDADQKRTLFEIGCGVGNFIFPLLEEDTNFHVVACDLSPRAVEIAKNHPAYTPEKLHVFQCDITTDEIFNKVSECSMDICTLIFVLSSIHPSKYLQTLNTVHKLLRQDGLLLFRDYGLYDMAQLRFKAGHKIDENFYMRQDGTRVYYFSTEALEKLLIEAGFEILANTYVHRRTVNKKEGIDVPRIFVQCKARKRLT